jgi:hypothetical protein
MIIGSYSCSAILAFYAIGVRARIAPVLPAERYGLYALGSGVFVTPLARLFLLDVNLHVSFPSVRLVVVSWLAVYAGNSARYVVIGLAWRAIVIGQGRCWRAVCVVRLIDVAVLPVVSHASGFLIAFGWLRHSGEHRHQYSRYSHTADYPEYRSYRFLYACLVVH